MVVRTQLIHTSAWDLFCSSYSILRGNENEIERVSEWSVKEREREKEREPVGGRPGERSRGKNYRA